MRFKVGFLLLVCPTLVWGRWLTPEESPSIMEHLYVDFQVAKDGTATMDTEYMIRVQTEDAKVSSSTFQVEYNALTEKVEILEAYTLNGKTKTPVPKSAMEDRDRGESRDYDALKVKTAVYPQVEVGSRLFVRYRIKVLKPAIQNRWSTWIQILPGMFVLDYRIRLNSEVPIFAEVTDPGSYIRLHQKNSREIEIKNRKPLPGGVHGEKNAYYHLANGTNVWVSTHKDWPTFFSGLQKDYQQILSEEVPAKLQPWLKAAAKKSTAEEKILYLMESMSTSFRYFGDWRRHDGGFVPRHLNEIESSRYGDCKDLSSILTAMLRALKINADVALVRRGENPWVIEPDYKMPAMSRFNHAIVRARVGDKTYWLDPTNSVASLTAFPDISGRPVWVLRKTGGEFDRIPETPPEELPYAYEYEYRFKNRDSAEVYVKSTAKKMAPFELSSQLMMYSRLDVLTELLNFLAEGTEVKRHKFVKEPKAHRTLKDLEVELRFEAGRPTYSAGELDFFVLPDGILFGAFYETENRASDLRLADTGYTSKVVRRLRNTQLKQPVPEDCQVRSEWMDVYRTVRVDGKDVLVAQNFILKRAHITKKEFSSAAFRKLQTEAKRCVHRTGLVIKTNGKF